MEEGLSARIAQLKAEWDAAQPWSDDKEALYWQRLSIAWSYNSNHIEGNTLTYGETYLLLIHGRTKGDHTFREYLEMTAHDAAIEHVKQLAADPRPLTEADVRDLNLITLKEPFWKPAITASGAETMKQIFPGQYKTTPNSVRLPGGKIFQFSSPEETPAKMAELVGWFRNALEEQSMPLADLLASFHHSFSIIHPFDDGNGRVMRLLINYALLRLGYPAIVIRSVDRSSYLAALSAADIGDLSALTDFIASNVIVALEHGLRFGTDSAEGDWSGSSSAIVKEDAVYYGGVELSSFKY